MPLEAEHLDLNKRELSVETKPLTGRTRDFVDEFVNFCDQAAKHGGFKVW